MKKIALLLSLTLFTVTALAASITLPEFVGGVNSNAIWNPSAKTLQTVKQLCIKNPSNYLECFNDAMHDVGASSQALAFNKYTNGWITRYQQYGKIFLIYAQVLAADYSDAIYFINTQGAVINIDDWDILQTLAYGQNLQYAELKNKYPKMFLSMSNHQSVKLASLPNNVQRFIFQYPLVNGCHACAVVGYANIGWDFDSNGNFINLSLLDIKTVTKSLYNKSI